MTFRERMKVAVSKAEVAVHCELTRRHLYPEAQYSVCLYSTTPDFYFHDQKLCIFIDGPPHAKPRRIDRDNGVDELLRKRGFKVARFPYKGTLTKQRLDQICSEIQEMMKQ